MTNDTNLICSSCFTKRFRLQRYNFFLRYARIWAKIVHESDFCHKIERRDVLLVNNLPVTIAFAVTADNNSFLR